MNITRDVVTSLIEHTTSPHELTMRQREVLQLLAEGRSMKEVGAILDQDTDNLFLQQEGLEASAKRGLTLGNYQEIRIRHFERAVEKYLAMQPQRPDRERLQSR